VRGALGERERHVRQQRVAPFAARDELPGFQALSPWRRSSTG